MTATIFYVRRCNHLVYHLGLPVLKTLGGCLTRHYAF